MCFNHLRQLRRFADQRDAAAPNVSPLILLCIDYCNSGLAGRLQSAHAPFQRIINAAVRLGAEHVHCDRVTESMKALHWLLVQHRIKFRLGVMMQSVAHDTCPA